MSERMLWLADHYRDWGFEPVEVAGWQTRGAEFYNGRGYASSARVFVDHHTASGSKTYAPSLGIVVNGRPASGTSPAVPGPLANILTPRLRWWEVHIIASGRSNNAGLGGWQGHSGNVETFGNEREHTGVLATESIDPEQTEWAARAAACWADGMERYHGVELDDLLYCFPAGVMVLTRQGFRPIEEIAIGDEVWTHRNRWRPVVDTMRRWSRTVRLRGHGHPGLVVTPNHPFWSPSQDRGRVSGRPGHNSRRWGEFGMVPAETMAGRHWSSPSAFDGAESPLSVERAWMIGHWLAEGSFDRGLALVHTCHRTEASEVVERAVAAGWHAHASAPIGEAQVVRVAVGRKFGGWVESEFGRLAHGKRIPGWVYEQPEKHRQAMLDGYLFGDGWANPNGHREARTVSKALALGLRLLGQSIGWASSLYLAHEGGPDVIKGRMITRKPCWMVRFRPYASSRSQGAFVEDWYVTKVKAVEASIEREVYDLTVEEDHSFVADGFVVRNCEHKEWAPDRKIDFVFISGPAQRVRVAQLRTQGPNPPEPSEELMLNFILTLKEAYPLFLERPLDADGAVAWQLNFNARVQAGEDPLQVETEVLAYLHSLPAGS